MGLAQLMSSSFPNTPGHASPMAGCSKVYKKALSGAGVQVATRTGQRGTTSQNSLHPVKNPPWLTIPNPDPNPDPAQSSQSASACAHLGTCTSGHTA